MTRPHTIVLVLAAATAAYLTAFTMTVQGQSSATEAPAGSRQQTNGFESQAAFDADRGVRRRGEIAGAWGRCQQRRAAPSAIRIR